MNSSKDLQKTYFDVLGICCSSEVPLIEKLLKPLEGVHHVSVIVATRTVIVVHEADVISQFQIGYGRPNEEIVNTLHVCVKELGKVT